MDLIQSGLDVNGINDRFCSDSVPYQDFIDDTDPLLSLEQHMCHADHLTSNITV